MYLLTQRLTLVFGAAFLLLLTYGQWHQGWAAWIAPALLLQITRRTRKRTLPLLDGAVALGIAAGVIGAQVFHTAPQAGAGLFWVGFALLVLLTYLPYVLDRWLYLTATGLRSTLIFPLSVVACEFAASLVIGNWGSLAYSQTEFLPVLQFSAVAGAWGVSFLVAWVASLLQWSTREGWASPLTHRGVTTAAALLFAVALAGSMRLLLFSPPKATSKGVALLRPEPATSPESWLEVLRRESRAGARFAFWPEASFRFPKADEWGFFKKAQDLTRKEHLYLFAAVATELPNTVLSYSPIREENKIVAFGPHGETVFEYFASHPWSTERCVVGDGKPYYVDTPQGRLGVALGRDLIFQRFARVFSLAGVDTVLLADREYRGLEPWIGAILRTRAVENGLNIVRALPERGLHVWDSQGRSVTSLTFPPPSLAFALPSSGTETLYTLVGDAFAWLCLMALVAWGILASGAIPEPRGGSGGSGKRRGRGR